MRTILLAALFLVMLSSAGLAEDKPTAKPSGSEEEQLLREQMALLLDVPVDLQRIRDELEAESETFEEKGVVSVEGGAACLDADGTGGDGAQMDSTLPRIDSTRAVLKVRIVIPDVGR
jgi:hypothetical protein